jgi:hypothetical protein
MAEDYAETATNGEQAIVAIYRTAQRARPKSLRRSSLESSKVSDEEEIACRFPR